jgi:chitodextrinase
MSKTSLKIWSLIILFITAVTMYHLVLISNALAATDTQPPTIPKDLQATNKTCRSISLCWEAARDNVKVKGYQLFRDGKKFISIAKTSYTNTDLIPGRTYSYTVKAYDGAGNLSENSAPISVTAIADNQPPSPPLNLTVTSVAFTTISLKWEPSTDNTSIKGYEISCNYKKIASASSTCYECKRLTPGMTYTFSVRSYDIAKNYSMQSNNISSSTNPDTEPPTLPAGLRATLLTETKVNLVWLPSSDNVKVRGYEIYCDGIKIGTSSKTCYSYKKLIPGKNYSFTVKAYDTVGNISSVSAPLKLTTLSDLQAPTVPGNLKAESKTKSSVSLTWNPSTDNIKVKGYKIFCNTLEIATTTSTHYSVKFEKGIGLYVISVKAFDLVDNLSGSSNTVTVIKA